MERFTEAAPAVREYLTVRAGVATIPVLSAAKLAFGLFHSVDTFVIAAANLLAVECRMRGRGQRQGATGGWGGEEGGRDIDGESIMVRHCRSLSGKHMHHTELLTCGPTLAYWHRQQGPLYFYCSNVLDMALVLAGDRRRLLSPQTIRKGLLFRRHATSCISQTSASPYPTAVRWHPFCSPAHPHGGHPTSKEMSTGIHPRTAFHAPHGHVSTPRPPELD